MADVGANLGKLRAGEEGLGQRAEDEDGHLVQDVKTANRKGGG